MKTAYVYRPFAGSWHWLCSCHRDIGARHHASWADAFTAADAHVRGAA